MPPEEKCIVNPERDCLGLHEAKYLKEAITDLSKRNSETHERIFTRLEVLERKDVARDKDFTHLMERFSELVGDLNKACDRLTSIEQKPAKRWESLVGYIISALAAGAIGFILATLGMK